MRKLFNFLLIMGLAVMAFSCADPEEPTAANQLVGTWTVDEFYVDNQTAGTTANAIERFTLERDGSFILEDDNGILNVGTWTNTETSLTLTGEAGSESFAFTIRFQSFTKMQLLQSITSPSAGTINITYLLNIGNNNTY